MTNLTGDPPYRLWNVPEFIWQSQWLTNYVPSPFTLTSGSSNVNYNTFFYSPVPPVAPLPALSLEEYLWSVGAEPDDDEYVDGFIL